MSARPNHPVDPRVHAVRTLAQLLVRHGPASPTPKPPEPAPTGTAEELADSERKAA